MLKTALLHPDILGALAGAGHGAQVLIADGNYPLSTGSNPAARRVYLNLAPGLVGATDVLRALVSAVPVEAAHVMRPGVGPEPPVFAEFRALLEGRVDDRFDPNPGPDVLRPLDRFAFYEAASRPGVCLAVATAEQRIYANLLLTLGVVLKEDER